ncbi:unnamed protein product [Sphagnum jensenii]|uniref:UBX domain-containing protein n=1 Tax=Sphagnum jensenii TaxID=128206 RepID=A0ABP0X231_9BRYO
MESDKVADFQEITGVQDLLLCHQVLQDHNWNLEAAVSSFLDFQTAAEEKEEDAGAFAASPFSSWDWKAEEQAGEQPPQRFSSSSGVPTSDDANSDGESFLFRNPYGYPVAVEYANYHPPDTNTSSDAADPHLEWKLVDLPLSIARGSYNLVYDAVVAMSADIAGEVLNYGLDMLRLRSSSSSSSDNSNNGHRRTRHGITRQAIFSPADPDVASFIQRFEREYGETHPEFQTTSFIQALRYAQRMHKFLFMYIHSSTEHASPTVRCFCQGTLCHPVLLEFVNANFVSWGVDLLSKQGQQMSKCLNIQTLPFCALVTAAPNAQIAVVRQIEGLKSAGELLSILQGVVEDHGPALLTFTHVQEEEEQNKDYFHLFEEQDAVAAHQQIGLQAYQEREERHGYEAEQIAREEALDDCQRRESQEEAAAQTEQEAAEKQLALKKDQLKRAMALITEPEKGPDVSQVLLWLPTGGRKQRRFESSAKVEAIYDYIDSLGTISPGRYSLVSNFPRIVYGPDKMNLTLRKVGLHPTASLFVEMN